jgi:molybdenum cofactor cytidylyltransferase
LQTATACYPAHLGQRGHPVGFSAELGPELAKLQGNHGAAQVFTVQAAMKIIVNDVGCVTDIDTLLDLEAAQELLRSM